MSLKRTPPSKSAQKNASKTRQLAVTQQTMDRSLSDSKLSEYMESSEHNVTRRFKRRHDEDLSADLCSFKEEIKNMIQSFLSSQKNELDNITSNLKEIQQSNHDIHNSIAVLTSQNEDFQKKIDHLECKLRTENENISILQDKIEDMQRENRKTNVEIKNVPRKNNESKEDLMQMILSLSKSIGCNAQRTDIKDIYRIYDKKNAEKKNTPVIVEMGSTILKTDMLKLCKSYNIRNSRNRLQAKHLGFTTNEHEPIYVSEHLTPKAARLYFLARDLTKSNQYKFCWTSFGRVYTRKEETSPVIQIRNESQVHQLLQGGLEK